MTLMRGLKKAWRRLRRRRRITSVIQLESMNELPSRLSPAFYIVGKPRPKWVVMSCPCGCGERIDANLMQTRKPYWKLDMTSKGISLWPSLWLPKDQCGSHFIVRRNRIIWVD